MNKLSLALVNVVALGLIGCGSGGGAGSTAGSVEGTTPSAGSTDSASAELPSIGTTDGSTVDETVGDTNNTADNVTTVGIGGDSSTNAGNGTAGETTSSIDTTISPMVGSTAGNTDIGTAVETAANATDGSVAIQGDNPGVVPDPILGEVSSIDFSTFAGPAGYKIYSGDAIDPALPTDFAEFVEDRYINLEFPCNSESGNIEVFPREFFGLVVDEPYGGTFTWEPADPLDEFGAIKLELAKVTYGAPANVGFLFNIDNIVNGSLIVGSSLFEDLIVTRIVQFDSCN